jgi:hypothetical protein
MVQLHRAFFHFSELPLTLRVVYTGGLMILGIGYIFAMIHIYFSHAGRDGEPGLSMQDLVLAYSGSEEETRLEASLKGSMSGMLPLQEREVIFEWIRRGSERDRYDAQIAPIMEQRCVSCHDGSNPAIVSLVTYAEVASLTHPDTGMSVATLVRVSHIHLFGITFIFFLMGWIFSHAYVRPVWLKASIAGAPFVLIAIDIGSWYLTKLYEPFAWVIMVSGAFLATAFAAMWIISIYQLWFYRLPAGARRERSPDL